MICISVSTSNDALLVFLANRCGPIQVEATTDDRHDPFSHYDFLLSSIRYPSSILRYMNYNYGIDGYASLDKWVAKER